MTDLYGITNTERSKIAAEIFLSLADVWGLPYPVVDGIAQYLQVIDLLRLRRCCRRIDETIVSALHRYAEHTRMRLFSLPRDNNSAITSATTTYVDFPFGGLVTYTFSTDGWYRLWRQCPLGWKKVLPSLLGYLDDWWLGIVGDDERTKIFRLRFIRDRKEHDPNVFHARLFARDPREFQLELEAGWPGDYTVVSPELRLCKSVGEYGIKTWATVTVPMSLVAMQLVWSESPVVYGCMDSY
jgi:hypothetical protein